MITVWYVVFLILGFVIGTLAGAGLSWLYAVLTIFKQIRRIFESITKAEEDEERKMNKEVRLDGGKDGRDTNSKKV